MKKAIYSIIVFLFITKLATATCIVVIVEKNNVYIGADSRTMWENGRISNINKIQKAGSLYVSFCGLSGDNKRNFFPLEIIKNDLGSTTNYTQNLKAKIEQDLKASILKELSSIRNNLLFITTHPTRELIFLQYIAIGFDNNIPFAHLVTFYIPDINKNRIDITYDRIQTKKNWTTIIGEKDDAVKAYNENVNFFQNLSPKDRINKIIDISIKHNKDVGKPIHILQAFNNRFTFIQ